MVPYTNRVDIFSEIERLVAERYEITTTSSVKKELEKIAAESKGADKTAANVGLQLMEQKKVKVLRGKEDLGADEELVGLAKEDRNQTVICTNDKELKRKIQRIGARIISLRGGSHLEYV